MWPEVLNANGTSVASAKGFISRRRASHLNREFAQPVKSRKRPSLINQKTVPGASQFIKKFNLRGELQFYSFFSSVVKLF